MNLDNGKMESYVTNFGSGSSFLVNTVVSTSATNANDLYLAGKTKKLTVV